MKAIGSLLVLLYADFVPKTVASFLKRCRKRRNGWTDTPIHRIVENSWIQCGGFNIKHRRLPCENYIVSHDRRGVFSTCNSEKHADNSVQFSISLSPTPWMDYKYVAFGQLLQGDKVLTTIESIETDYESPTKPIMITGCGEFQLDAGPDLQTIKSIEQLTKLKEISGGDWEPSDLQDVDSRLSVSRYQKGWYCLETDLTSNTQMLLSKYLEQIYGEEVAARGEEGERDEDDVPEAKEEARIATKMTDLLSVEDIRFKAGIYKTLEKREIVPQDLTTVSGPSKQESSEEEHTKEDAGDTGANLKESIELEQYKPLYL